MRVLLYCGQLEEYNISELQHGFRPIHDMVKKGIRMEGFIAFDYTKMNSIVRKHSVPNDTIAFCSSTRKTA